MLAIISGLGRAAARNLAIAAIGISAVHCDAQPVIAGSANQTSLGNGAAENAVLRWNEIISEMVLEFGPVTDSRAFAIFHVAIHDAVNTVARRFQPYALNDPPAPEASLDAAVASAAHDVLMALIPSQRERTTQEYVAALAAIPNAVAKERGILVGRRAAQLNLARRAEDGVPVGPWPPMSGPITQPVYAPTGKPGDYAFTSPFDRPPMGPIALFPGWGALKPFALDISKYPLPGPDPLTSDAYMHDVDSTRAFGGLTSAVRTRDQGQTAFFWFEPFENWNGIVRAVLADRGLDAWESARVLALTYIAVADAGIACFAAKYRYRFWRPITAIHRAAEDGNPNTAPDKEWLPLLSPSADAAAQQFFTPPIPDYPSAAATLSWAAAEVLKNTIGDEATVSVTSHYLPGVTRRFTSFSQIAHEAAMSRFYGGIHFLRAVRDGESLGRRIGRDVSPLLPALNKTSAQRSGDM